MQYISTAMLMAMIACSSCKKEAPKPVAPPPPPPAAKAPEAPKGLPAPADVAAAPADAEKTASGLASKVLQKGTGTDHPGAEDTVKVHYTGWMTDGKMFDSSVVRGQPAEFPLNGVIKGWTEGVQLMVEGENRRFWIPANLAYGDTPRRPGAPSGTLVFDIELFSIKKAPPAPAVPTDVSPDAVEMTAATEEIGATTLFETDTTVGSFRAWFMVATVESMTGKTSVVNRSAGEATVRARILAASAGVARAVPLGSACTRTTAIPAKTIAR